MTDRPGLDFSFSGLKTFTLNTINAHMPLTAEDIADIATAFEIAVVDTLLIKCRRAVTATGVHDLVIAGGVSANQHLREKLDQDLDARVHYAPLELCTDNGAMIAYTGALRLENGESADLEVITKPRWPISDLTSMGAQPS